MGTAYRILRRPGPDSPTSPRRSCRCRATRARGVSGRTNPDARDGHHRVAGDVDGHTDRYDQHDWAAGTVRRLEIILQMTARGAVWLRYELRMLTYCP